MADKFSHPAVRDNDGRVTLNEHVLRAFVDLITGELTPSEEAEFAKQIGKGDVKITNKGLIWLRDNYGHQLREYFEAVEMRTALGWLKPTAVQMKAINSLEQRMGWRDINTGRLTPGVLKQKVNGKDYRLEVKVKPLEPPIEAEKVDGPETPPQ